MVFDDASMNKVLDKSALEMVEEFEKFFLKERAKHPDFSKSDICETFVLQRISNLQVAVTLIFDQLKVIERKLLMVEKNNNASH